MGGTVWSVDFFTGYEGMPAVADDLGCRVLVTSVEGWSVLAAPRVDRQDRPYLDGSLSGPSTQPGKAVTIRGVVKAPGQVALLTWIDRFTGLLTDGDRSGTLTAAEAHLTRYLGVQRGDEAIATPRNLFEGDFSMILWADDPKRLGDPLTASTGLPLVTGGLRLPVTLPFTLDSAVATGQCSLFNPGTAPGPVLIRLHGPVIGASQVTHAGSGPPVAVAFGSALSLPAGQWLDIDMDNQQVLANGQVERAEFVTNPGWSAFDKGRNTWSFAAANYSAAYIDVIAHPAWF
ncbi:MAG: hypothetical protein ABI047_03175 [Jatrophihabitantaceae bacterium]